MNTRTLLVVDIPRGRRRVMELLMKTAVNRPVDPVQLNKLSQANKQWHLVFLRSPTRFMPHGDSQRVGSVQFAINRLEVSCHHVLCVCMEHFDNALTNFIT